MTDETTPADLPNIPASLAADPAVATPATGPAVVAPSGEPTAVVPPVEPTSATPPAAETPKESKGVRVGVGMLVGIAVAAVALGFLGGIVSHALFPAQAGAQGKQGKAGEPGKAGEQGPPGSAANINLAALGVCFVENTNPTGAWVTSVYLSTPVITNGTQSCPQGTFVPVQGTSS